MTSAGNSHPNAKTTFNEMMFKEGLTNVMVYDRGNEDFVFARKKITGYYTITYGIPVVMKKKKR